MPGSRRRRGTGQKTVNLFSLSLVLVACSSPADQALNAPAASTARSQIQEHVHEHASLPAAEAVHGASLHQLEGIWQDQQGRHIRMADFAGQVLVLAMVYTHCDNACPRIIVDMRRIRKTAGDEGVRYALASFDPERDTVAHLKQFGADTGLTQQGWQLLRAPESTARELAAVLGVQYAQTSASDFAHSNVITVLGPDGVIAHQQSGLGVAPEASIEMIHTLLKQGGLVHHPHH